MRKTITLLSLIALPLFIIGFTYSNDKYFLIAKNLDIFATLFKEVNAHYVDEIDPSALIETGINAMMASLDPYTNYIPEEDLEDFLTITTGQYAGIGILVGNIHGTLRITRIYPGFSGDKGGLEVGDEIVTIGSVDVSSSNIGDIGKMLRGQQSSEIQITVNRPGKTENLIFLLQRENISMKNVPYYGMYNSSTGYIKLDDFTSGASKEVKEALLQLKKVGAKSIILDLRGNGGGLLSEAINISNLFIEKGNEIVRTKGRIEDWNKSYRALNSALDISIPLVVLVDEGSASASEVVAGVIQDYDRGILIGRETFGKGLVQTTRALSYDAQLKITTAKYYIPSGRCIQAIDYAGEDPVKIQDSDRLVFYSKNGREFYDGSGLQPDIQVEPYNYSVISQNLSYEGYLFEYGLKFREDTGNIPGPLEFSISDSQYEDFINWMKNQDFSYTTELEYSMEKLKEMARSENYYEALSSEIESLESNISVIKEKDLINFQEELKDLLSREIAGIYYNFNGEIESSFRTDMDLEQAANILSDPAKYKELLAY